MIQSINSQTNPCKYQPRRRNIEFAARTGTSTLTPNPAKVKRNKILKTGFFVFLGVKIAMLADLVFAKGKHIKALWNSIKKNK